MLFAGEFGEAADVVEVLPALEGLNSKAGKALIDIRWGLERLTARLLPAAPIGEGIRTCSPDSDLGDCMGKTNGGFGCGSVGPVDVALKISEPTSPELSKSGVLNAGRPNDTSAMFLGLVQSRSTTLDKQRQK